jgi:hypothetical protein
MAMIAVDEGPAKRGVIADASDPGVGFLLPNQLVADFLVVLVDQCNGGAEHDLVARQGGGVDDQGAAQPVLDLRNARLDMTLAFLGGVIFRVLAEIAMSARHLDRIDD